MCSSDLGISPRVEVVELRDRRRFATIAEAADHYREALLVPDTAIGTEQAGKFVLVVDAESVARPKSVTLGPLVDDLRVITDGLARNDNVIVSGLMRARPGVKVAPQQPSLAAAPAAGPQIDAD